MSTRRLRIGITAVAAAGAMAATMTLPVQAVPAPTAAAPAAVLVPTAAWPSSMSIDPTFDMRARGLRGMVEAVTVRSDGTILAAGRWTLFRDRRDVHMGIAAVRPDGSPDWDYTRDFDREIESMAVDAEGRLLVSGVFGDFDGTSVPGYARLLPDGTLDRGFTADVEYSRVGGIDVGADGTVALATETPRLLATDGSTRASVATFGMFSEFDAHVAVLSDGGALFGGEITALSYNPRGHVIRGGISRDAVVRVTRDGVVDPAFTKVTMPDTLVGLVATPDGGAWAASADGTVLRVAADGSTARTSAPIEVSAIQPLDDGGVVVLGSEGTGAGAIAVLRADGSLDSGRSFMNNRDIAGPVTAVATDGAGRLVVGGHFDDVAQVPSPGLTRIGHVDSSTAYSTTAQWPTRSAPAYLPVRTRSRVSCVVSNCGHKANSPHGYWAVDFLGRRGEPVYPSGAGVAHVGGTFAGCAAGRNRKAGIWVWVDHGNGVTSRYYHLDSLSVRNGQKVNPDTPLGTMGRTGAFDCSGQTDDAAYLHYEVRSGGTRTTDRVRVGTLVGCSGTQATNYPEAFGTSDWNSLEPYVHWVSSDGTACRTP